jgi:site-specific recombinase XerD
MDTDETAAIREGLSARGTPPDKATLFVSSGDLARGLRSGGRQMEVVANPKTPDCSTHSLRRLLPTWLLDAVVPIAYIADLLGYSSVVITTFYAKVVHRRRYVPSEVPAPVREMGAAPWRRNGA